MERYVDMILDNWSLIIKISIAVLVLAIVHLIIAAS